MSGRDKQDVRKKEYKKGLDPDDARRKREEGLNSIRKQKQQEQLEKRRNHGAAEDIDFASQSQVRVRVASVRVASVCVRVRERERAWRRARIVGDASGRVCVRARTALRAPARRWARCVLADARDFLVVLN